MPSALKVLGAFGCSMRLDHANTLVHSIKYAQYKLFRMERRVPLLRDGSLGRWPSEQVNLSMSMSILTNNNNIYARLMVFNDNPVIFILLFLYHSAIKFMYPSKLILLLYYYNIQLSLL